MLVYAYQQQSEAEMTAAQPNSPNRRSTRINKKSLHTEFISFSDSSHNYWHVTWGL